MDWQKIKVGFWSAMGGGGYTMGRRATELTVAGLTAWVMFLGIVLGAGSAFGEQIHACVKGGKPRVVSDPSECKNNEAALSWNIAGEPGMDGESPVNVCASDGEALLKDGTCMDIVALVQQLKQLLPGFDSCAFGVIGSGGPYVDNCDGTITDTSQNPVLIWEKKVAGASGSCLDNDKVHSVNATCNWNQATVDWPAKLNTTCSDDPSVPCSTDGDCSGVGGPCGYAGSTDWRLPLVGAEDDSDEELETILLSPCPGGGVPCIDPIFGPTAASDYWSSVTDADDDPWVVNFNTGGVDFGEKFFGIHVRAVRTGP